MTPTSGERAYPRLFSPFRLGPLALPNRFVVPGLTTNYASADGFVTDALCTYLAARARGGFGLIVTENLGVHPGGRVMPRMAMIDDDRYVPGLARLAAAVKRHGAAVVGQLSHAGRQTKSAITGLPLVAPSALACPINREPPRALEVDEIQALEQLWGVRRFVPVGVGFSGDRAAAASSYDVLASADGIAPGSRAVVIGDDLASGDAALILAARGVVVELRSPAHDIAVDAHPGYRELIRRSLERLGAAVVTGVRAEPASGSAGDIDIKVVRGRDPRLTADDVAAWEMPRVPRATRGWLDDAYEPGRMTRTVYDAVAHAMLLDGS